MARAFITIGTSNGMVCVRILNMDSSMFSYRALQQYIADRRANLIGWECERIIRLPRSKRLSVFGNILNRNQLDGPIIVPR